MGETPTIATQMGLDMSSLEYQHWEDHWGKGCGREICSYDGWSGGSAYGYPLGETLGS